MVDRPRLRQAAWSAPACPVTLRPCSPLLSHAAEGCLHAYLPEQPFRTTLPPRPSSVGSLTGNSHGKWSEFGAARFPAKRSNAVAPAPGVCRENARACSYAAEVERAIIASGDSKPQDTSPKHSAATVEEVDADLREELFQKKAADVSRMLEGIARNVRLDHLSGDNREAKLKAERDEERRCREAEERRARQRERQARDPQKKVALKLENRRRFGRTSSVCGPSVPMHEVEVSGQAGNDKVGMVDVASLRNRCQRLNPGSITSVDLLLQDQRRREREDLFRKSNSATLSRHGSVPTMCELRLEKRLLNELKAALASEV
eukprot:TRINITY_DN66371_c0_g1_i1.p1 TRINITY_DN66371_c0_g1~~TRINITY_DN66371_c0_g1_i1.p1  ORF type:complete len:318 (-),score=51.11 TRINITY_DN66371_c0_g1_i1:109-1062(-)